MINSRQQKILAAVIKEHVDTAEPVSSGILVEKYNLRVSPATIRADMKELEREGYLFQPHTSAGRVPTDKGYRFFIDSLMKSRELTVREQDVLRQNFLKGKELDYLMQRAANLLADLSSNFAISSLISLDEPEVFKAGIGRLLREPEFGDSEYLSQTTQLLDYLDRNIEELFDIVKDETIGVYIGRENPIKQMRGLSMIVSGQKLKSGNRGLIAILGPQRMRYERNIALIEYIRNLLDNF
jgi:transcriptional regulator of heat shock response